jgi:nucleotide-binding universal stress UspA family protein
MKILVGVDGTRCSRAAVAWAAQLAETLHARVTAVHVVPSAWEWEMSALQVNTEPTIQARRRNFYQRWTAPLRNRGIDYSLRFLQGEPAKKLLEIAEREHSDLIVLGGKPNGRVHNLIFGSVVHELVTNAPCPVVTVPAEEPARPGHVARSPHLLHETRRESTRPRASDVTAKVGQPSAT